MTVFVSFYCERQKASFDTTEAKWTAIDQFRDLNISKLYGSCMVTPLQMKFDYLSPAHSVCSQRNTFLRIYTEHYLIWFSRWALMWTELGSHKQASRNCVQVIKKCLKKWDTAEQVLMIVSQEKLLDGIIMEFGCTTQKITQLKGSKIISSTVIKYDCCGTSKKTQVASKK